MKPDVTLMDLRLPDMSGIEALVTIRATFVNARIIILTTFQSDADVRRALEAGARGFLFKTASPDDIIEGIRQVHAGKKFLQREVAAHLAEFLMGDPLTPREMEILKLISAGNRNRDVGAMLSISEDTVKVHVKHVMEKLDASDRTEAVVIAVRRGLIQL
jgi:DNA-binding NarL/FixJ family response regulator